MHDPANPSIPPPTETFDGLSYLAKRSFAVLIQNFVAVTTAFLILGIPVVVLFRYLNSIVLRETAAPGSLFGQFTMAFVILICVGSLFTGVLAGILASKLAPSKLPLLGVLQYVARRLPLVIVWTFVSLVIVLAGLLLLILPGIYLALRLLFVPFLALLEPDKNPLRRSWEYTQHQVLEVFFVAVGISVFATVASLISGLVFSMLPGLWAVGFVGELVSLFLSYALPLPFWLMLYGWFREKTLLRETWSSPLPQDSAP